MNPGEGTHLTRTERAWLLSFVCASSAALLVFALLWGGSAPFFGDADYKWRQIEDLLALGPTDISCRYPARDLDLGLGLFTASNPVVVRAGRCFYLYPFALSFVMAPSVWLGGKSGVFVTQQLLSATVMALMIWFGRRLRMSGVRILLSLVLFRFGTGNLLQSVDLEEHTASTVFYLAGAALALCARSRGPVFVAGVVAGAAFLFRPELSISGVLLPVSLAWARSDEPDGRTRKAWLPLLSGLGLSLTFFALLNYRLVGHPLGIKAFDPLHAVDLSTRAAGIVRNVFFHPVFVTNGLLFHMPLLLFLAAYARRRNRAGPQGPTVRYLCAQIALGLPVLLVVAPSLPTAAAGFRFAAFLYPVMILLVVRLLPSIQIRPVWGTVGLLMAGVSVALTVGLCRVGLVVEREFRNMNALLRAEKAPVMIIRDRLAQQAVSSLFFETRIVFAGEDSDVVRIVADAGRKRLGEVAVVRHVLGNQAGILPEAVAKRPGVRVFRSGYLDVARLPE